MQCAFRKPHIVIYSVFAERFLQRGNIQRKRITDERLLALLLAFFQKVASEFIYIILRMNLYIIALIAVLGKFNPRPLRAKAEYNAPKGFAELINLSAASFI